MVQPLHLQDNLSKLPLMQKIYETIRAVPETERNQFEQHMNQQVRDKANKTQDLKETEKLVIRERQKSAEERKKKNSLKKPDSGTHEKSTEKDNSATGSSGHLVDITV